MKAKRSSQKTAWYRALEEWHEAHGFDVAALFESRPDLFRALVMNPVAFGQGPLLDEYLPRVRAAAQRAQAAPAYRAAFEPAAEAHTEKQKLSVGLPEKHRARRTRQ